MSVARLARDVLPQPWLLHRLIKHVAPRVRAEADREWAARELGLVPFSGRLHWSVDQRGHQMDPLVELRWPFAPLADAIADAGRRASADLVRRLADGAGHHHATRARGSLHG